MNLSLEKKILYSTVFCKYREKLPYKLACRHPYSYGVCDIDLCPLAQSYFANVIFQVDGIYLVIKKPSENKVAGEFSLIKLEVQVTEEGDNEEEVINTIKQYIAGLDIPDKMFKALLERVHRIYDRFRFLRSKGEKIPILETPLKAESEVVEGTAFEEGV